MIDRLQKRLLVNVTISTRQLLYWLSLMAIAATCPAGVSSAQTALEQVTLTADASLGQSFSSEIDLLFVYDAAIVNSLPYTQFDWISDRESFQAQSEVLEILTLHITAESLPVHIKLTDKQNSAAAVLVFASHADPVAEAIDITHDQRVELRIMSFGVEVTGN